ncbi:MAG TPA: S9 family peptidase [Rubricoccaceae bacterium]|nr:S9 family peptidase [Rubricoccaceae bacterium]
MRRLMALALFAFPLAHAQTPPDVAQRPYAMTHHGVTRTDPYYWLRERENPEVIQYLEAENAYTEAMTAHLADLREGLFTEIVGRIQQDESSAPFFENGYWYYTRFEEGKDYPVYARRRGSMEADEEILLNANERAEGHGYYAVGNWEVTEDGNLLAFAEDTVGRRIYTLRFKDLRTGAMLPDVIHPVSPSMAWANDNRTLFFARQDLATLRTYQILRHTLGQPADQAAVVFQEDDTEFSVGVSRSKSDRFLLIGSSQTLADEYRYLDADDPMGAFVVFRPRERGHEHTLQHAGNHWYVRTNLGGATNFQLMRAPTDAPDRWEPLVPHRADVLLENFDVFEDFVVTQEREGGLSRLRVRTKDGALDHEVDFGEPTYAASLGYTPTYDTDVVRYNYASMTTPQSAYDYDLEDREATLVKRQPVLGDFDPANYVTERLWATARDGTPVPISLVRRRETPVDGTAPLLLYGYGSYGASSSAGFSIPRLSLLDRGFIYAIAHIRGGQEMGRAWYDRGKLLQKMNTFTDFIDAAEHLVAHRYADPERLYAQGGSAGGLLMGAVVNLRPDLWDGVIANVPFVDVVTTMLDETIPLTTFEYDEWGNPADSTYFRYMLAYSPYDNVRATAYPPLLVTTGLHDSQVQYWEPAKWVARLRDLKTDQNALLLRTNMEAGHGGASGRFRRFREIAFEYAWLLDQAGLATQP